MEYIFCYKRWVGDVGRQAVVFFCMLYRRPNPSVCEANQVVEMEDVMEGKTNSEAVMEDVYKMQQTRRSRDGQKGFNKAQIQDVEKFKGCPLPEREQKDEPSNKLSITPDRVTYWFQKKRKRMKAQMQRTDHGNLSADNKILRIENQTLKEALEKAKAVCQACGGPALSTDLAYKDCMDRLYLEISSINDELKRVSAIVSERSIESLKPSNVTESSGKQIMLPTNDAMLRPSHTSANVTINCGAIKGLDKSSALIATRELIQMALIDKPLWSKKGTKEVLNLEIYGNLFPGAMQLNNKLKKEATRDTTVVMMNAVALVDFFMDVNKWIEMFPSIVRSAKTLQVLFPGISSSHKEGLLQLMYAELQVLSPLVSTRVTYFLRYCHLIREGKWAVIDFSEESMHHNFTFHSKRPSGCIIQELPNGNSKVTWVEHSEAQETGVDGMYEQLVESGMAFGAQRWVATLERQCQRLVSLTAMEIGDQRRIIMELAQRMMNNFCQNISASTTHLSATRWHDNVRITRRMGTIPKGIIICAATSLWLPVSPQILFDFLRDGRMRSKWDMSMEGNSMQEINDIPSGSHPGNSISLFYVKAPKVQPLILQESCTDLCGSLLVYSRLDIATIDSAMKGGDLSSITLLPSGFVIHPDGSPPKTSILGNFSMHETAASSSTGLDRPGSGGSLLTAAFQILGNNFPAAELPLECEKVISNFVSNTMQRIKVALLL